MGQQGKSGTAAALTGNLVQIAPLVLKASGATYTPPHLAGILRMTHLFAAETLASSALLTNLLMALFVIMIVRG